MTKQELRSRRLLDMLRVSQRLKVRTVAEGLDISEATVRRLFTRLEEEGKAIRVFGGVQLAPPAAYDYSYRMSAQQRAKEKTEIGNAASQIVESNERLFLDSGTTVLKLAEALSLRIQASSLHNIVVLTNSLTLIETLARYCKVILVGGEIRVERRDVCGTVAEKALMMFHADRAFLGADAIHQARGFMATDERTARMNEVIIERTERIYVLADSSKFHTTSFITYAGLDAAETIFTDGSLEEATVAEFTAAGAHIRRVQPEGSQ
jgi:DeoR/GlpR family transcriptional regulator of sugar metabolism